LIVGGKLSLTTHFLTVDVGLVGIVNLLNSQLEIATSPVDWNFDIAAIPGKTVVFLELTL